MNKTRAWISSLRLRTLPLALSGIGMGSFLAAEYRVFKWPVFIFASITAILLQILSNLANDYGDAKHGADGAGRIGPDRGLQSGDISLPEMRNAIIATTLLALLSGFTLLYIAAKGDTGFLISFLILGLLCIAAAIKYTVGKKPYGYAGLGDISVFFFFGPVAVAGTFYLYTHALKPDMLLPAAAIGLLSCGVLNINNMRDHLNDREAGKKTLVVRIGLAKARLYHIGLIAVAAGAVSLYAFLHYEFPFLWLFLIASPLLMLNIKNIATEEPGNMDRYLKQLAIATVILVIGFGAGVLAGAG